jgi:hypothetical protein
MRCDYLGQLDPLNPGEYLEGEEPRSDFIPRNASVMVLFQGAPAIADGSKEVDVTSATDWETDITKVNSNQFIRYRVVFDLLERGKEELSPTTPRPSVQNVRLRAEF